MLFVARNTRVQATARPRRDVGTASKNSCMGNDMAEVSISTPHQHARSVLNRLALLAGARESPFDLGCGVSAFDPIQDGRRIGFRLVLPHEMAGVEIDHP